MRPSGTNVRSPPGSQRTATVRERERPARWDVQRGLVRADRAHLVRDDAAWKLVSEVERLDVSSVVERVQSGTHAAHGDSEALDELPARAVVVPVGQDDVRRRPVLGEPVEPVRQARSGR